MQKGGLSIALWKCYAPIEGEPQNSPPSVIVFMLWPSFASTTTAASRESVIARQEMAAVRRLKGPTYGSWINLVERWFAEITNQRIRRGVFRSVKELEAAIREYVDVHKRKS
jgi:hypothetical protein